MKKLLAIFFSLSMRVTLFAQGCVIDEVSKDDSGGIFSGIMGVFLLILKEPYLLPLYRS